MVVIVIVPSCQVKLKYNTEFVEPDSVNLSYKILENFKE